MSDLTHTLSGKVQAEDVDFRAGVDPVMPTQVGHNINYLKDGYDQNAIDITTALVNKTKAILFSAGGLVMTSPQIVTTLDPILYPNKEILCAIVNISHPSNYRPPFSICAFKGGLESSRVMYAGSQNVYASGGAVDGGQFFVSIVQGPSTTLYNSVQVRCKGTITGNYSVSGVGFIYV